MLCTRDLVLYLVLLECIQTSLLYSNPNHSLDCYALMKPSFCHLFRHFSVTMEPHCALKAAKHLSKNRGYYHHNANDRFGFKENESSKSLILLCNQCSHVEDLSITPPPGRHRETSAQSVESSASVNQRIEDW